MTSSTADAGDCPHRFLRGRGGGRPWGQWGLAALLLTGIAACSESDPVEPTFPTPVPVATATPPPHQPPPTPTPLPYESSFCNLLNDMPAQLRQGQEFTLSASMIGKPGIGRWDSAALVWAFLNDVVEPGTIVSFEGQGLHVFGATGETGWSVEVAGGVFQDSTRLAFSARFKVRQDARLGYALVDQEGSVFKTGMENSIPQRRLFYIEIVP